MKRTPVEPATILVIDDEATNRKLMAGLIDWLGYRSVLAGGGAEGLRVTREQPVDLVLLDLMMPDIDGLAVLDALREEGKLRDLPVIVVTALDDKRSRIEALQRGAVDFLTKPVDRHELACRLHNLLAMKQVQDALKSRQEELESAVKNRTEQYEALLQTAPDLIMVVSQDGTIHYLNRPDRTCTVGGNLFDFLHPHSREPVRRLLERAVQSSEVAELHLRAAPAGTGSYRTFKTRLRRLPAGEGPRVVLFATDVTERLQAERTLRDILRRVELVQQSQPLFLYEITFDQNGPRPTWTSDRAEDVLGFEPLTRDPAKLLELVPTEERGKVRRFAHDLKASRPENWSLQHRLVRSDGKTRWLLHFGMSVREGEGNDWKAVGLAIDVTDRNELEQQLAQNQKMEALGRLAGGIAHDFNNLLTAIMSHASLVLEAMARDDHRRPDIQGVLDASRRAAALTRKLLAFSRRQPITLEPLDLNQSILSVKSLLERTLGKDIRLEIETAPVPAVVMADGTQIDQLLLNLAVNSRDAMPEGGTLRLSARRLPERVIELTVSDSGEGMPPDVQTQIFQPFFTTKPPGKGTGLGLATCYGIVTQLKGEIRVESELGEGTTFHILLPEARDDEQDSVEELKTDEAPSGTPLILVVDDDDSVRTLLERALSRHGYSVVSAGGIQQARREISSREQIAAVLTDENLPDGFGTDLITWLLQERPQLARNSLLLTGGDVESSPAIPDLRERLVAKPFEMQELIARLRELLE